MNFSFREVSGEFDNHIEKSIRGYNNLIDDVINISPYFIESDTNVVDIGSSTGKMIKAICEITRPMFSNVQFNAVEIEKEFNQYYTELVDNLHYHNKPIQEVSFENCSLVYSIFTLQFLPRKTQREVVENIYKWLNWGGRLSFLKNAI